MRKNPLVVGQIYHVFTKSIARFNIFNNDNEFFRIIEMLRYYQQENPALKFSKFINIKDKTMEKSLISNNNNLVGIIAYSIMPTHIHLILKQIKENGISNFMRIVLNSYTRYFNIKHTRKGPLWEGRFKSVLVKNDEQLLHLTRYLHLNPVTAYLIEKPEDWIATSYKEYLSKINDNQICEYQEILEIEPKEYKKFVEDRISYQRDLGKIKDILLD